MRITLAAVLVALMGSGAALAQTPEERIEAAMTRAAAAGIPTDLLEDKVREGRAKNVAMPRIAEAVERRAEGLARAQEALSGRPDVGPTDLALAADALEAGVGERVVQAIADFDLPADRRQVALAVLTELVELGEGPARAFDRVSEALTRGPEALLGLAGGRPDGRPPVAVPAGEGGAPTSVRPDGVPAPGTPPQGARPEGVPAPGGPGRP